MCEGKKTVLNTVVGRVFTHYNNSMIEEKAIVTGVEENLVTLQMQRQSVCSQCELGAGCGTGAIGRLLGHRSKPLTLSNKYNLKVGDKVVLGMPDKAFLIASLLIYGLPLLGLLAGGVLAQTLFGKSEMITILLALTGFTTGFIYSAVIARRRFSRQFNPLILDKNGEPRG